MPLYRGENNEQAVRMKKKYILIQGQKNDDDYINLTGILSYIIKVTQIPKQRVTQIDQTDVNIFWRSNIEDYDTTQTMYLVVQEKIQRPKFEDGLGFRRAQYINAVKMAKL